MAKISVWAWLWYFVQEKLGEVPSYRQCYEVIELKRGAHRSRNSSGLDSPVTVLEREIPTFQRESPANSDVRRLPRTSRQPAYAFAVDFQARKI